MIDLFRRIPVYTAEEIHNALYLSVLAYLDEVNKEIQEFKVSSEEKAEIALFQKTGLINSTRAKELQSLEEKEVKVKEAIEKNKRLLRFILEMSVWFDHKTVLVRFEDFERIIKKYDLWCGELSDFTGDIPRKNLEEVSMAQDRIRQLPKGRYIYDEEGNEYRNTHIPRAMYYSTVQENPSVPKATEISMDTLTEDMSYLEFFKITGIEYYNDAKKKLSPTDKSNMGRFPFLVLDDHARRNIYSSWDRSFQYLTELNKRLTDPLSPNDARLKVEKLDENLFIVAPKKEMRNCIDEKIIARPKDPFVCSYSKHGVLIHSKWGAESEDELMVRYDHLYRELSMIL